MALNTFYDRRQIQRVEFQRRVELDVLPSQIHLEANSVNLSEAGICLRLQEALDISAQVRLRLFADASKRPVECGGRIAWVVQRLDLRDAPPFLYDVGIEFVELPARLRAFVSHAGGVVKATRSRSVPHASLRPAMLKDRWYTPCVERESSNGGRWHLVVTVDGVPCFSQRYPSEREAIESWQQFKRQVGKRPTASSAARRSKGTDREGRG